MSALKVMAQEILEDPMSRQWTIQGLGMLRTYLPGNARLHVWDPEAEMLKASKLHTHPWDMTATVISGSLVNRRYKAYRRDAGRFFEQEIRCGQGGGLCGQPVPVQLTEEAPEEYVSGDTYEQGYAEIHESQPDPGTVTLIERHVPDGGNPDFAYVYYMRVDDWGTAEPRPATTEEIRTITSRALEGF